MRIIVADDDPDFRILAIRALRREFDKAEYVEVFDQDKLERVLAERQTPDLLISDYSLGWTSGFEVLEAVRQAAPLCAAIMFTGTGNEEVAVGAIKAGFDDYVVKSSKQLRHLAAAARMAVARAGTRRGLEENRDLLTQELYHRLHNNLQLVISLIAFTARGLQDRDAKRKLEDLSRRVQALSALQERLYRGRDFRRVEFGAFLRELVDDLVGLHPEQVEGSFQVEDAAVPVDAAVPLALIANELITNALKHAFAGSGGQLAILFRSTDDGRYVLGVDDNGPGPADAVDGMGTRLVQRLAQQLAGTVEITPRPGGGTACRVTVAAERGG
jgi:two-component sensor histidine kinase